MMRKLPLMLMLFSLILLSACSSVFKTTAQREMETAQATLESFFSLLAYGAYEQAAGIYGGQYDVLIYQNPHIPPDDVEALWRNACQNNGYQCLEIKNVISGRMDENGFYHFMVEFQQKDGSLFVAGPCCGASETEMPPQSQFEFTVRRDHGVFSVADLPVYIP